MISNNLENMTKSPNFVIGVDEGEEREREKKNPCKVEDTLEAGIILKVYLFLTLTGLSSLAITNLK